MDMNMSEKVNINARTHLIRLDMVMNELTKVELRIF